MSESSQYKLLNLNLIGNSYDLPSDLPYSDGKVSLYIGEDKKIYKKEAETYICIENDINNNDILKTFYTIYKNYLNPNFQNGYPYYEYSGYQQFYKLNSVDSFYQLHKINNKYFLTHYDFDDSIVNSNNQLQQLQNDLRNKEQQSQDLINNFYINNRNDAYSLLSENQTIDYLITFSFAKNLLDNMIWLDSKYVRSVSLSIIKFLHQTKHLLNAYNFSYWINLRDHLSENVDEMKLLVSRFGEPLTEEEIIKLILQLRIEDREWDGEKPVRLTNEELAELNRLINASPRISEIYDDLSLLSDTLLTHAFLSQSESAHYQLNEFTQYVTNDYLFEEHIDEYMTGDEPQREFNLSFLYELITLNELSPEVYINDNITENYTISIPQKKLFINSSVSVENSSIRIKYKSTKIGISQNYIETLLKYGVQINDLRLQHLKEKRIIHIDHLLNVYKQRLIELKILKTNPIFLQRTIIDPETETGISYTLDLNQNLQILLNDALNLGIVNILKEIVDLENQIYDLENQELNPEQQTENKVICKDFIILKNIINNSPLKINQSIINDLNLSSYNLQFNSSNSTLITPEILFNIFSYSNYTYDQLSPSVQIEYTIHDGFKVNITEDKCWINTFSNNTDKIKFKFFDYTLMAKFFKNYNEESRKVGDKITVNANSKLQFKNVTWGIGTEDASGNLKYNLINERNPADNKFTKISLLYILQINEQLWYLYVNNSPNPLFSLQPKEGVTLTYNSEKGFIHNESVENLINNSGIILTRMDSILENDIQIYIKCNAINNDILETAITKLIVVK